MTEQKEKTGSDNDSFFSLFMSVSCCASCGNEEAVGKRAQRDLFGEVSLSEKKEPPTLKITLSCCEPEGIGKALWNPEQSDGDLTSRSAPGIASQADLPREASVSALRARKDHVHWVGRGGGRRWYAHLDPLLTQKPQAGAPMLSAAPVAPKQRG